MPAEPGATIVVTCGPSGASTETYTRSLSSWVVKATPMAGPAVRIVVVILAEVVSRNGTPSGVAKATMPVPASATWATWPRAARPTSDADAASITIARSDVGLALLLGSASIATSVPPSGVTWRNLIAPSVVVKAFAARRFDVFAPDHRAASRAVVSTVETAPASVPMKSRWPTWSIARAWAPGTGMSMISARVARS
ncbi:MAG: hypothetical protein HY264_11230 [Chloroflexi bacterium]|nr:hypothetical protein [Chloroflexota bacterium]